MDEFELIRRFFPQADADGIVLGIGDDAAVLEVPPGYQLVQALDTMIEDVHFPAALPPADIARRLVAANLSDLAAMAAIPRWMLLSLAVPEVDANWLAAFAEGLRSAARAGGITLVGGDTTRAPVVSLSLQVTGMVEPGEAVTRGGARAGDGLYVSGHPGDAAGGLRVFAEGGENEALYRAFAHPVCRTGLARELRHHMSAAIDISDGLYGDLGKLLSASGVAARLQLDRLPLSAPLVAAFGEAGARRLALTGGDDYELLFTAPAMPDRLPGDVTRIGDIVAGDGIECLDGDDIVDFRDPGYLHFQ